MNETGFVTKKSTSKYEQNLAVTRTLNFKSSLRKGDSRARATQKCVGNHVAVQKLRKALKIISDVTSAFENSEVTWKLRAAWLTVTTTGENSHF